MEKDKKMLKVSLNLKIVIIVVAIIIVTICAFLTIYNHRLQPIDSNSEKTININIESGTSTDGIGSILKENGLIRDKLSFKIFSKIGGYSSQYKAGNYVFSPTMSISDIADILVEGREDYNTFTIPEGYTIVQTAESLFQDGLIDKKVFLEAVELNDFNYQFLKNSKKGKNQLEGFLFPNTYQVAKNASELDIINIMLRTFDEKFKPEYYKRAKELGYSVDKILTVASIIERECRLDKERPIIASVIYNRLESSMPLQMCSTVQYVLGKQKEVLTNDDTEIDSPYNTYQIAGLPPTPICSPGEASIKAALYPEDTEYVYFVVSEKLDGSHNFSKEYNKFLNDSKAYYDAVGSK